MSTQSTPTRIAQTEAFQPLSDAEKELLFAIREGRESALDQLIELTKQNMPPEKVKETQKHVQALNKAFGNKVEEPPIPETVEIGGIDFPRRDLAYLGQAMVAAAKLYQACLIHTDFKQRLANVAISEDFWQTTQIIANAMSSVMQSQDV